MGMGKLMKIVCSNPIKLLIDYCFILLGVAIFSFLDIPIIPHPFLYRYAYPFPKANLLKTACFSPKKMPKKN